MINVLYVTYASVNFDGATYSLMDLIKSVQSDVHPIVLLSSKGCVYDYFVNNGIECIVCNFEANVVGKPKTILQYIKYVIKYIPLRIRFFTVNRKCVKLVAEKLSKRNISIIHSNNTVLSIGMDLAKEMMLKHVWHLRGFMDLDFGWKPLTGWNNMKKHVSECDAVIGITKSVLEHYIPVDKKNAFVVFDAVRSKNEISFQWPKEKYFLFCAGFLSNKKGCDFAIKAFARSNMATQGYRLRLIGEYTSMYFCYLRELAQGLGVLPYIDFLGRTDDVKSHMEKASAFLMCSENEGLGRVTVEAMFYGCLVFGRKSGGTKEFVLDKQTGYTFNTIEECASLLSCVENKENLNIIQNAQTYVCQNFSIENYGKKIINIYKNLIR